MKNCKKLLAFLTSLTAVAGIAGCSGGGGSSTPADSTAAATTAATAAEDSSSTADNTALKGNEAIKPLEKMTELTAVIGYGSPEDPDTKPGVTPETNAFLSFLEENYNIKVTYLWSVPSEQYKQKFRLAVASGATPDIMRLDEVNFKTFRDADGLADLGAAYEQYAVPDMKEMFKYFDDVPLEQATYNDKLLSVPYPMDNVQNFQLMYYRQDWLDKLGLEKPTTIQEFIDVAVAFAEKDPDGNGEKDSYGLALGQDLYSGALAADGIFEGVGAYPYSFIEKDGQLVCGTIQPEVKRALQVLKELYGKGAINPEFAVMSSDQNVEQIVSGKAGIVSGEWWVPNWPLNSNVKADKNAKWEIGQLPSEDGNPGKSLISESLNALYNVASSRCTPEQLQAFMTIINLHWDINENPDSKTIYDEGYGLNPKNGYVYNWSPVYSYRGNTNSIAFDLSNKALDAKDPSLASSNREAVKWYEAADAWLTKGLDDENGWSNWGMYLSRVDKNGGVGQSIKMKEAGNYVLSKYYGPPTATEVEKSTTLNDMTKKYFADFIMGNVTEDSWDKFVSDWLAMGGEKWTAEVNEQYKAL